MMEQMTLKELEVGMHVKLRDGSECVVSHPLNDDFVLIDIHDGTHEYMCRYEDNMRSKTTHDLDIVEVKDSYGIIIFAEETMTKTEAEEKFGIRIVD